MFKPRAAREDVRERIDDRLHDPSYFSFCEESFRTSAVNMTILPTRADFMAR
jgi:hypothetical protein